MERNLLFWHKMPSGKQSFPVPVSVFLPQSLGVISSFPVAWGDWVPSSRNVGLNGLVMNRAKSPKIPNYMSSAISISPITFYPYPTKARLFVYSFSFDPFQMTSRMEKMNRFHGLIIFLGSCGAGFFCWGDIDFTCALATPARAINKAKENLSIFSTPLQSC